LPYALFFAPTNNQKTKMRTGILIAKAPGQPATAIMGPDHIDIVKAEFKRHRFEPTGDYEAIELWTSGQGRTLRAKLKADPIPRPSRKRTKA
jgi:hypothetical protein